MGIKRIWCTDCDINMEEYGDALDCPVDGKFFICPLCDHRIVVFMEE